MVPLILIVLALILLLVILWKPKKNVNDPYTPYYNLEYRHHKHLGIPSYAACASQNSPAGSCPGKKWQKPVETGYWHWHEGRDLTADEYNVYKDQTIDVNGYSTNFITEYTRQPSDSIFIYNTPNIQNLGQRGGDALDINILSTVPSMFLLKPISTNSLLTATRMPSGEHEGHVKLTPMGTVWHAKHLGPSRAIVMRAQDPRGPELTMGPNCGRAVLWFQGDRLKRSKFFVGVIPGMKGYILRSKIQRGDSSCRSGKSHYLIHVNGEIDVTATRPTASTARSYLWNVIPLGNGKTSPLLARKKPIISMVRKPAIQWVVDTGLPPYRPPKKQDGPKTVPVNKVVYRRMNGQVVPMTKKDGKYVLVGRNQDGDWVALPKPSKGVGTAKKPGSKNRKADKPKKKKIKNMSKVAEKKAAAAAAKKASLQAAKKASKKAAAAAKKNKNKNAETYMDPPGYEVAPLALAANV